VAISQFPDRERLVSLELEQGLAAQAFVGGEPGG
jgi:hypothetical protein